MAPTADTQDPTPNREPTVTPEEEVTDTVYETSVLVVETHNVRSDAWAVPALAGTLLSDVRNNNRFDAGDPVVEVVYLDSLDDYYDDWTPEQVVEDYAEASLPRSLTVYAMPDGRLD